MNASRRTASACGGPMVMAVMEAPSCLPRRNAVSNAYKSYGFIFDSTPSRFNTPVFGSISTWDVPGTCFMQTMIFMIAILS